jgi:hypothetical protein
MFVLAALALSLPPAVAYAKKRGGRGKPAPSMKSAKPPADEVDAADVEDRESVRETNVRETKVREAPDADTETDPPKSRRRATVRATSEEGEEADVVATAESAESTESGTAGRWLELAVGARGFTRDLRYHQLVTPSVRQHQLALGPAAVLDLAFYPLALATTGPLRNIGLVAGFEQAVGITSQLDPDATFPSGAMFPTSMHEISGGLRYRIPIGASQIGVAVTGGQHAFWLVSGGGADRSRLEIPDVVYRFVRAGLDARLAVTPEFFLSVGAGYRQVLNGAGHIQEFFPHLTVAGIDAEIGAGYRITRTVEARVQGGVRRYFYDMHSKAGDARLAGGAIDQYLSVAGLLALTLE